MSLISYECDLGFVAKPRQEVEVLKYSPLLIMFVKSKCFHCYKILKWLASYFYRFGCTCYISCAGTSSSKS